MIRLDGRVAIVTGAGGGLGRAHALLLAQRGARVIVNDIGSAAEEVVQEIVSAGGEAAAAVGSVTDHDFVDTMREQTYGRIVMTTSSSGLYGNFGQSNYGAAKMALVGLMQTLSLEGERHVIFSIARTPIGRANRGAFNATKAPILARMLVMLS